MKSLLPRATSSSNSKRLQRRISADFVPIFDDNLSDFDHLNTNQLTPETKTKIKSQKFIKSFCLESVHYQDHIKQEYRVIKQILKYFWFDFQIILQSLLYLLEFSRFSLTLSLYIKGPIFHCLLMYIS